MQSVRCSEEGKKEHLQASMREREMFLEEKRLRTSSEREVIAEERRLRMIDRIQAIKRQKRIEDYQVERFLILQM